MSWRPTGPGSVFNRHRRDEERYGNQDTDGSRSTRHFIEPMRRCGAAARAMLETAAAAAWRVPVAEVHAVNHEVVHAKTGRKLGYGALARKAAKLPVPPHGALTLKPASQFRYIGKEGTALLDGADIVTGKAQYGIDPWFEGMLFAVIARSPVLGGKIARFDGAEAAKLPGVVNVLEMPATVAAAKFHPLAGVAVIATDTGTAIKARAALKIQWDDGANGEYDSELYRAQMEKAARSPGKLVRETGDFAGALAQAAHKVEAEYYLPHIAHATMEPPCAVARIVDGKCEVWAPTQAPQVTREDVSKHLGLPFEQVTVHVTLLGGGFGRKSKPDFAIEAALLSKAMKRPPGQGHLDPRGRSASRFLSYRVSRAPAGRTRCGRQGHVVAASKCGAQHRLHLRSGPEARAAVRAGHGPDQSTV